jgi:hypothetical protein
MLKPRMQPNFWYGDPFHWIYLKHSWDKISSQLRKMGRQTVHSTLNFLKEIRDRFVIERKTTTKKSIKDNTTRPNIYFRTCIKMPTDDFRSSIIRRPTTRPKKISISHKVGETEISDLDIKI